MNVMIPEFLPPWESSATTRIHFGLPSVEIIDADPRRAKSEIIFNKYGNTLVMKQIWVSGSMIGYLVPTGNVEKNAAKSGSQRSSW